LGFAVGRLAEQYREPARVAIPPSVGYLGSDYIE
jgi:hypothetical protein